MRSGLHSFLERTSFVGLVLVGLACAGELEEVTPADPKGAASATVGGSIGVAAGTVRVDMLDVGQGDGVLIRTPAKTILIDASEGEARVASQLKAIGVAALDLVVATHPHADHIGGMDDVVEAFPIKLYLDNGLPHTTQTYLKLMSLIETKGVSYRAAVVGTVFNLDMGVKFEVLFPSGTPLTNTRSDLNSNSVVTRLTYGTTCFLFTGDSEEPTEQALLRAGIGHCDVLKVAHHGSNHSSTPAFLSAVSPSIALISVGTGNRYGHPGEETMARLSSSGATIYRTDQSGPVTAISDGKKVTVQTGVLGVSPASVGAHLDASHQAIPSDMTPASPATNADNAACPYYASSSGSEVFHEASCDQGKRGDPARRICYPTRDAAVASGRRPGGCCNP
jgi:competence protein ComEC